MTDTGNQESALSGDETDARPTWSGKRAVVVLLFAVFVLMISLGSLIGFVLPPGDARIDLVVVRFQPSTGWLALLGGSSVGLLAVSLVLYSSIVTRYDGS